MNSIDKKLFYKYFEDFTSYNIDDVNMIADYFESVEIGKNEILQESNQISKYTYLVIQGCLINYSYNTEGEMVVLNFIPENYWTAGGQTYLIEGVCIKSIEYTKLFRADSKTLEALKKGGRNNYNEILALREALKSFQLRLLNTLTKPAIYNYKELLIVFPTIEQRVPQKYIASYLGVTPQFFSKMRTEYLASK